MNPKKGWAAFACVVIALTGVALGWRWITVSALILWVIAMALFGLGQRRPPLNVEDDA